MSASASGRRLAFVGKALGESLFWLAYALFFGGVPILVYFTMPGATVANLIVGALVGLGLLGVSVLYVGRHQAITLYPEAKRFFFVRGLVPRWEVRTHEFAEVARVEVPKADGSDLPSPLVRITLKRDDPIVLELSNPERAKAVAERLSKAFSP